MYSLLEVLSFSEGDYLSYMQEKLSYLLHPKERKSVAYLLYHYSRALSIEEMVQEESFWFLLSSFSYVKEDPSLEEKERQFLWIFRHPWGGYFIPLEALRVLLLRKYPFPSSYLLSYLQKLPIKEHKAWLSLLHSYAPLAYLKAFSQKKEYRILLIYHILGSYFHRENPWKNTFFQERGILLDFFSGKVITSSYLEFLSLEPVDLKEHFLRFFPDEERLIREVEAYLRAGSPFYRSLELLPLKSILFSSFQFAYFIPLYEESFLLGRIYTPKEVYTLYQKQKKEKTLLVS